MKSVEIRKLVKSDLSHLKNVLDTIDLFPSDMLPEITRSYFTNSNSEEIWFTALVGDKPISIGYCAPEKLAEGTYNLYAIGVKSDLQGNGIGKQMMEYIENYLLNIGARVLIVETSGTDAYSNTRSFYKKLSYTQEAVIRDFWKDGDDKVVFWKKLKA